MLAGSGFGLFYICFSRVSDDSGMWPVAIERTAATATLVVVALALTRGPVQGMRGVAPFAVGAGALEVAASVPLLLALQRGPYRSGGGAVLALPRHHRDARRNTAAASGCRASSRSGCGVPLPLSCSSQRDEVD